MKVSVLVAFHEVHLLFSLLGWRLLELVHDEVMKDMAQLYLADEDEEDVDGRCLELRKLWMADDRSQLTGLRDDAMESVIAVGSDAVEVVSEVGNRVMVDVASRLIDRLFEG